MLYNILKTNLNVYFHILNSKWKYKQLHRETRVHKLLQAATWTSVVPVCIINAAFQLSFFTDEV